MRQKKQRLYLAFYTRHDRHDEVKSAGPVSYDSRFHSALLLTPKKPKSEASASRYQVALSKNADTGRLEWTFSAESKISARMPDLLALVLLGKVPAEIGEPAMRDLLRGVAVSQSDPPVYWHSRVWICDAMDLLVEKGIIPKLPASPEGAWYRGGELARRFRLTSRKPVPTCNTRGIIIESEIHPFKYRKTPIQKIRKDMVQQEEVPECALTTPKGHTAPKGVVG